jgi:hypothetical protein
MATSLALIAGCATLKSTKIAEFKAGDGKSTEPGAEARQGIAYSLPYAKVWIKAVRVDVAPAQKSDDSTKNGGGKATPGRSAQAAPSAGTAEPPAKEAQTSTGGQKSENQPQPDGSRATNNAAPFYDVTIQAVYEPDPDYIFLLNPKFNALSADTYRVAISNGLLTTITSTNADKTGEVLIDLAKIGIESFKIAAGLPAPPGVLEAREKYPKQVESIFDPSNDKELVNAQAVFDAGGFKLEVARPLTNFGKWTQLTAADHQEFDGFFYRTVLPYTISVTSKSEGSSANKTLLLPNGAPILCYSPERSPMVERVTQIALENGALKEVYVSKPSSIAATVKVPLSILQSIVALPTDLVQLKLNYSSADKNLLESQKAEIDAMRGLLEAQRNLLQAQINQAAKAQTK